MPQVVCRQHNLKLNDISLGVRPLDVELHGISEVIFGNFVVSSPGDAARAFVTGEAVGTVLLARNVRVVGPRLSVFVRNEVSGTGEFKVAMSMSSRCDQDKKKRRGGISDARHNGGSHLAD